MAHRVGAYVRISDDIDGKGLGVSRQLEDCRALAAARRWELVGVYEDNDVSAFKTQVIRPEFERLIGDLDGGSIDGVVVYDLDRFARKPSDLERAIDIFDRRKGLRFATVQSDIDLSSADGRTLARVMVAFANKSSMDTSRRVRRKHLELAQAGIPVGGTRPFGWKPDRRKLDRKEAKLIRDAADQILRGIGITTICRRWNEAGVTTPRGNRWQRYVLKSLMTSPRLAGFRVHQGEAAIGPDGQRVIGQHEPILDVATWEAVCSALQSKQNGRRAHIGGRKYLLSGIARCANCSNLLSGNAVAKYDSFYYACRPPTSGPGCGTVSASGKGLDGLITKLVLGFLADVDAPMETEPWTGESELADLEARMAQLMAAFSSRELSAAAVFPTVAKLEDEIAALRADRASWHRHAAFEQGRPSDVVGSWPEMDVAERRALVGSVLSAVLVRPATKRGNRFDPDRVEVVWR